MYWRAVKRNQTKQKKNFSLVWTDLHFVLCGDYIDTVYQDASFFLIFCIYDYAICKAEVGNKSSSDADITIMAI